MVDSCAITRGDAVPVLDEVTGEYTPTSETVYAGKCKLKAGGTQARDVDLAAQALVVQSLVLHLPVAGSEGVTVGDTVTVTSSALDPGLVGNTYRVNAPYAQSFATARRFPIEEVSGG